MDLQRFEILEDKISKAIKLIQALKHENEVLRSQVESAEARFREKDEELIKLRAELNNVQNRADESQQMKEREEKIRSKVEEMLAKLEELQLQF